METDVLAVVIAAISVAVAVWAKVDSGKANRIANQAVGQAERANEISLESNSISLKGNDIAVAANKLAEEANTAVLASGALQTERNDVVWEASWKKYGILQLANEGKDPALNVHAVVDVEGERRSATDAEVGSPSRSTSSASPMSASRGLRPSSIIRSRTYPGR